jgi:hypothetical protein
MRGLRENKNGTSEKDEDGVRGEPCSTGLWKLNAPRRSLLHDVRLPV